MNETSTQKNRFYVLRVRERKYDREQIILVDRIVSGKFGPDISRTRPNIVYLVVASL